MKAEIIAVGTELLMGEVINTNAGWISGELAKIGVDVHHHVTVGDNPSRMRDAFFQAAGRADCLVLTGGLGPTDDDITVEVLADSFCGKPMLTDPSVVEAMQAIFARRGIMDMPKSNLKQALRPAEALALQNPVGTAPGLAWEVNYEGQPVLILVFPGVPRELKALWPQAVAWLQGKQRERGEMPQMIVSRFIHFFGISESALAERMSDLMQAEQPTLAPYVGKQGIRLRIAAKAASHEAAEAVMQPVQQEVIRRASEFYLGVGKNKGDSLLEEALAERLIQNGWTIGVAESCTGGLISDRLTDYSGSGNYTFGNVVAYSPAEKTRMLGVKPETLARFNIVSPEVAAEMAQGIQKNGGYSIGLSITGLAGPSGDESGNPAGLAYVGLYLSPETAAAVKKSGSDVETLAMTYEVRINPSYSRKDIKYQFSQYALFYAWQTLSLQ